MVARPPGPNRAGRTTRPLTEACTGWPSSIGY
jgi:hypothetical protein